MRSKDGRLLATFTLASKVREPSGAYREHLSRSEGIPLELGEFVVLHQFLVPGEDAVDRTRTAVIQAVAIDRG